MNIYEKVNSKIRSLRLKYFEKTEFIIKTKFNFKLKVNVNRDVDRAFYLGYFESETLKLFSDLILPGSTIVDVGANIGIYSLIAAGKHSHAINIYAFEPSDWAHNRLLENIHLNSFEKIKVFKKAVSNINGSTVFHICEDDAYNSLGTKPMKQVVSVKNVETITLDEFCKREKVNHIDILKIDTEGADYLVLCGGGEVLSNDDAPIILCEYNRYTKANDDFEIKDMLALLKQYNYNIYELTSNKLVPFNPDSSQAYEIICLKNIHHSKVPIPVEIK